MKTVGIILPMEEEIDALKKYLMINREFYIYELKFYESIVNNIKCVLVQSGVGKVNAARTTQVLIDNIKVDCIINVGVAGGLSEDLKILDIVIADKLIQHDFDISVFDHEKGYIPNIGNYIEVDKYLFNIAKSIINENKEINCLSGTIASGDIFLTDRSKSQEIKEQFNAICVEMEAAAIAQVCYLCKVPFLILRSISDIPNNDNKITYEKFLDKSTAIVAEAIYKILLKLD